MITERRAVIIHCSRGGGGVIRFASKGLFLNRSRVRHTNPVLRQCSLPAQSKPIIHTCCVYTMCLLTLFVIDTNNPSALAPPLFYATHDCVRVVLLSGQSELSKQKLFYQLFNDISLH